MATPEIRMYDAMKPSMGEESAKEFIKALEESRKEFFKASDERFTAKIEVIKSEMATKSELNNLRVELIRTIYIVGLVQFIAIIGSVIAIIKTMM